jgi:hypothetical protein
MIAWLMLGVLHQRLSKEAEPWTKLWASWVAVFFGVALLYGSLLALLVSRVR